MAKGERGSESGLSDGALAEADKSQHAGSSGAKGGGGQASERASRYGAQLRADGKRGPLLANLIHKIRARLGHLPAKKKNKKKKHKVEAAAASCAAAMVVVHLLLASKFTFLHAFKLTAPLLWPFNVRAPLARHLSCVCETVASATALLGLRARRVLDTEGPAGRRLSRWERALRMFWHELLVPLGSMGSTDRGGRGLGGQAPVGDGVVIDADGYYYRHRRSMLLNALDASIIQGLLALSI